MELVLDRLADESNVMRLVRARQEGADDEIAVRTRHHLLGQAKSKDLLEQLEHALQIVAIEQAMIEMRRRNALQAIRPWIGVDVGTIGAAAIADIILFRKKLHRVAGRNGEAEPFAGVGMFARGNPFVIGAQAGVFDVRGELFQSRRRIHFPAHIVHSRMVGLAQNHRMMVEIIPGLEKYALGLFVARRLDQAKDLGVVVESRFQIENSERNMPRS